MKNSTLFLIIFLSAVLTLPFLVHAELKVLRPTLDGSEESDNWFKTGDVKACSDTKCYTAVRESSGSECGGVSDGDSSYIFTEDSGSNQTFKLSEVAVPNGSRITDIEVSACHKGRVGESRFTTRLCIGGDCINGEEILTTNDSYTQANQSFPVDIIKTGATDFEIGVRSISAGFLNTVNVSTISAEVTYTPPACNDGMDNDGDGLIDFPDDEDCKSPSDRSEGPFSSEYKDGVLIPTINLSRSSISFDESLKIYGYYRPNTTLEIVIDDFLTRIVESNEAGYWEYNFRGEEIGAGLYYTIVREVDSIDKISSPKVNFKVTSFRFPESDLNDDGVLDMTDLSIFLSRWRTGGDARFTLDMNGDGFVGIRDFSIFIYNLKF